MHSDTGWEYTAIVVEKRKLYPELRPVEEFYPKFCGELVSFVLRNRVWPDVTPIVVYTDTLPVKSKREAIVGAIKSSIKSTIRNKFGRAVPFCVYNHPRISNVWLQVVDYCCWAVMRKWEKGDLRAYDKLGHRLAFPELDILRGGSTHYY